MDPVLVPQHVTIYGIQARWTAILCLPHVNAGYKSYPPISDAFFRGGYRMILYRCYPIHLFVHNASIARTYWVYLLCLYCDHFRRFIGEDIHYHRDVSRAAGCEDCSQLFSLIPDWFPCTEEWVSYIQNGRQLSL